MAFRRKAPRAVIERTPAGFVVNLDRDEIDLVARLMDELRGLLTADDPRTAGLLRRLFPPAYIQDEDAEAEAEYQRLMREELVASRLESLTLVEQALRAGTPLDDAGMNALLQSLNSVRLVLGTLLDVSEDHDPSSVADDDPMVGEHHLYVFLSWLLDAGVHAVTGY